MTQPILSIYNHYQGINAHLNSNLQARDWEEFHANHISDIQGILNQQLRGSGYYARLEKGLQIKYEGKTRKPESDVLIEDYNLPRSERGKAAFPEKAYIKPFDVKTALLTPDDMDTEYFPAVVLYPSPQAETTLPRKPAAWIELLSPTNKQGGSHYIEYLMKREALLATQSYTYVEIDYLHRTSPTLRIKDYSKKQAESTPYHVAIIDTRQPNEIGRLIQFSVDETIPDVPIPLHGEDVVELKLNAAYQHTFSWIGYGFIPDVAANYAEPPADFHTYSQRDQEAILKRLALVQDFVQKIVTQGINIEQVDNYIEQQKIQIPL